MGDNERQKYVGSLWVWEIDIAGVRRTGMIKIIGKWLSVWEMAWFCFICWWRGIDYDYGWVNWSTLKLNWRGWKMLKNPSGFQMSCLYTFYHCSWFLMEHKTIEVYIRMNDREWLMEEWERKVKNQCSQM